MTDSPRTAFHQPPILGLSDRSVRVLHVTAFAWALLAIAGLMLATRVGVVDHRPGGDAYELQQQQVIAGVFGIAVVVSWKWEVIGGTIASTAAAAIVVFASRQLEPLDAAVVIVAFVVPGALWILIYLHDLRPRPAVLSIAIVVPAVIAGGWYAQRVYDGIYGPSHPASELASLPGSDVEWIWSGGVTGTSAVVTAKLDADADSVRLAVGDDAAFADPVWFEPIAIADGVVRFEPADLSPDVEYHYAVEVDGGLDHVRAGSFRTFPAGPSSFTIAAASCMRVGTNGAVFDAIRELDPVVFLHVGDFHYANIGDDAPDEFRDVLDLQLTRTAPAALFRSTPIAYVWDDHDYGDNNADATSPSRPAAMEVFREYVPHYPLQGDDAAIGQAFTIGRVRVIMTDTRSARSPTTDVDDGEKTMLGDAQRQWFEQELLAAADRYPLILWVNSVPWIAAAEPGGDDWGGYSTERAELADAIAEHDIEGLVMVSGDAHMVAIDDGTNSDFSTVGDDGFPVLHAAALDRPGHAKGGPYSHGVFPGSGQFGLIEVTDDGGDQITVELSGRTWEGDELVSYEFLVPARP
jgi:hypothetical protein